MRALVLLTARALSGSCLYFVEALMQSGALALKVANQQAEGSLLSLKVFLDCWVTAE